MADRLIRGPFDDRYRGLKELRRHPNPSVNVIAVHGLAADPIQTWVDKKEKWNWLENQLVDIIPGACVWTFGYESSWVGDRSPDGEPLNDPVTPVDTRLTDVAKCLLDAIKEKASLQSKPLIFVAHSFGGIVVLKALMIAEDPENGYATDGKAFGLFSNTDAALFFGTPFRGTHEWFQKTLPRRARDKGYRVEDGVFETFRQGNDNLEDLRNKFLQKYDTHGKPNVGFLREGKDSNVSKIIKNEDIPMPSSLPMWTRVTRFWGEKKDSNVSKIIKNEDTMIRLVEDATIDNSHFHSRTLVDRDHFNIHKFGKEDGVFEQVRAVLKLIVPPALQAKSVISSTNAKDYDPRDGENVVFECKLESCQDVSMDSQGFLSFDLRVLDLSEQGTHSYETKRRIAIHGSGNQLVCVSYWMPLDQVFIKPISEKRLAVSWSDFTYISSTTLNYRDRWSFEYRPGKNTANRKVTLTFTNARDLQEFEDVILYLRPNRVGCEVNPIKVSDDEEVRIYPEGNPADDGCLAISKTTIEDHSKSSKLYFFLPTVPSEFYPKISMTRSNEVEMQISGLGSIDYKSNLVLCYPPEEPLEHNPEGRPTHTTLKPAEDLQLCFRKTEDGFSFLNGLTGWDLRFIRIVDYVKTESWRGCEKPRAEVMLWTRGYPRCTQLVVPLRERKWLTGCVKPDWEKSSGWLKRGKNLGTLAGVEFCRGSQISRRTLGAISREKGRNYSVHIKFQKDMDFDDFEDIISGRNITRPPQGVVSDPSTNQPVGH